LDAIVKYISSFIIYKVEVSATCPFLGTLGTLAVGPKAALGVGNGEAAQKVGGDIENPHTDLAIGGNLLAVAKPRAYHQGPTPRSRGRRSCGISSGSRCAPSGAQLELTF